MGGSSPPPPGYATDCDIDIMVVVLMTFLKNLTFSIEKKGTSKQTTTQVPSVIILVLRL